jgi:hypothetical protein
MSLHEPFQIFMSLSPGGVAGLCAIFWVAFPNIYEPFSRVAGVRSQIFMSQILFMSLYEPFQIFMSLYEPNIYEPLWAFPNIYEPLWAFPNIYEPLWAKYVWAFMSLSKYLWAFMSLSKYLWAFLPGGWRPKPVASWSNNYIAHWTGWRANMNGICLYKTNSRNLLESDPWNQTSESLKVWIQKITTEGL